MKQYHALNIDEALDALGSQKDGLSAEEAAARLKKHGPNELAAKAGKSFLSKLLKQFESLTVIILIIAAVISFILGETADAAIIFFVVILNAALGILQEEKAEKSLDALKKLSKPFSRVLRGGAQLSVKSSTIVPGDILLLEAGDIVPADMRLIFSASLKTDESALTGESEPSLKDHDAVLEEDCILSDRVNMVYSGCSVLYGRASGIAATTGMNTEVGRIAKLLEETSDEKTPLEKKLNILGKYISIGVVFIAAVIFTTGLLGGRDPFDMFLTAVALAVAAIPEGLPAIVTIVLALGVQRMAKRNAIVRTLPAVETLGSTEVICSDKTGTLTQNKMTVREIFINGTHFRDTPSIRGRSGEFERLAKIMVLSNDAFYGEGKYSGDPTETALLEFFEGFGYIKSGEETASPRKGELPFDSVRKLMTTINMIGNERLSLTKGAPDVLVAKCSRILINDEVVPITSEHQEHIRNSNNDMGSRALRVLGAAYNDNETDPENNMIFVGLTGMMDPPRPEAFDAVLKCAAAGITTIMITGDHAVTALAVAGSLNIASGESDMLTGDVLNKLTDEEFEEKFRDIRVYARVSPEHKVRIVKAWKKDGKVVAMTGDGVNDAPALKSADIGVGMGITGTEVSKSVSDIILTDDNFATIVNAVEEGRKIFANIRKSVQFLLSANIGEVLTLFVATLAGWQILLPIHILWINLVTDTLPAVALGMEKAEEDIMKRPPVRSGNFFTRKLITDILYQGVVESLIVLAVYMIALKMFTTEGVPLTMAFVTLGFIQLCHAFNVRTEKSAFKYGFFSNKYLNYSALISAALLFSVVLLPFLSVIFKVVPLNILQWGICIGASLSVIFIVEMVKLISGYLRTGR